MRIYIYKLYISIQNYYEIQIPVRTSCTSIANMNALCILFHASSLSMSNQIYANVYVSMYVYVCMCMCVCMGDMRLCLQLYNILICKHVYPAYSISDIADALTILLIRIFAEFFSSSCVYLIKKFL